jgi:chromosome segregation ATPase
MAEERRQGFDELARHLKENGESAHRLELLAKESDVKLVALERQLEKHDHRTLETRDAVMETQGETKTLGKHIDRLSDKIDHVSDKQDATIARVDKIETREEMAQKVDDAKLNKIPMSLLMGGAGMILLFVGYHIDTEATNSAVAAFKGIF